MYIIIISPSLISLMVSMDVKHHVYLLTVYTDVCLYLPLHTMTILDLRVIAISYDLHAPLNTLLTHRTVCNH